MRVALSAVWYWAAQTLGYRRHYFSGALYGRGYAPPRYMWLWIPKVRKGTYLETRSGWRYAGFGSHL